MCLMPVSSGLWGTMARFLQLKSYPYFLLASTNVHALEVVKDFVEPFGRQHW